MTLIDERPPMKSKFWNLRNEARARPQPWRWPLQRFGDREPLVLAEHDDGKRRGIDLGYAPLPFDRELFVPVYAAQDGDVMLAGEIASGCFVSMNHSDGHATYYAQLSKLFVATNYGQRGRRRQRVRGGEVIGYAARSPIQIRFEVWSWTDERGFVPADPSETMAKLIPTSSVTTALAKAA